VRPRDAAQALASLSAALEFLAADDPAEWSEGLQADCLLSAYDVVCSVVYGLACCPVRA